MIWEAVSLSLDQRRLIGLGGNKTLDSRKLDCTNATVTAGRQVVNGPKGYSRQPENGDGP